MLSKNQKSTNARKPMRNKRQRLSGTSSWLVIGLAVSAVAAPHAMAAPATPAIGDTIVNPVTGATETVVEVNTPAVRTDEGHVILLPYAVGDTFDMTDVMTGTTETFTVTDVRSNAIDVEDSGGTAATFDRVKDSTSYPPGSDASGVTPFTVTVAPGDLNYINSNIGKSGGDGRDGGGLVFKIGAITIDLSYNSTAGGAGAAGLTINADVTGADLHTSTDGLHAILVSSIGGNGGQGGDFYGVGKASPGGAAGPGGAVTVNNHVDVTTTGDDAAGIFAQSRAGQGGAGGAGYGFVGGGSGGLAVHAGPVSVTNRGTVATTGDGSVGIQAQSLGGGGGDGGRSYGVIVDGGGGSTGGNGGTVEVFNYGIVQTEGEYAHGILAQSIGGSGGSGGRSAGLISFGNSGSDGGDGGSASITAKTGSSVLTQGEHAHGLFAQSVGGGGGAGKASGGLVTLGASGGAGGNGGAVTVTIEDDAVVATKGDNSQGVFAQSIGGGGGDAGKSSGLITLGGKGTTGGLGGAVTVSNAGTIDTAGVRSRGIFAQSVGGGGGAGGDSGGLIAIGGTAGAGSTGGAVSVGNSGTIITRSDRSAAIQAQSIGGGGGDGGTSGGVLVTIGGSGTSGGGAGTVAVNNTGTITTYGDDSHGIFAQSVGGGGGNGGASKSISLFAGVAVGGSAGSGGEGGDVDVTFENRTRTGLVFTDGDRSRGIFAQSVGGGGGSGGMAAQVSVGLVGAVSVAVGGSGGDGGQGGTVNIGDVTNCLSVPSGCYATTKDDLNIRTRGDNSEGLYIQSVGGGGGAGGYTIAAAVAAGPFSVSVATGVGGSAGSGGKGGDVTIRTGGTIETGAVGGAFVARDGEVTTEVRNSGEFSTGLLAQSVGGGGGKGGYNISASVAASGGGSLAISTGVGGTGGDGGIGGTVDVDFNGSILTHGDDASGAIIQSVGGGGGAGGYNISAAVALSGGAGLAGGIGVGGSGGAGNSAGVARGVIGGDVYTTGARSTGVVVQSVGGGGGNGGFNVSGSIGVGSGVGGALSVGVGGSGAGGGEGGEARGTVSGKITTTGDEAGGLLVQSVGGGGGNGGFNVAGGIGSGGVIGGAISVSVGGSAGTGSNGGYVEGRAKDLVQTSGKNATGVTIQSLGGGGGNGGFAIAGGIGSGGTAGGGINVGLGGSGGAGGEGGEVHGFAAGITTSGDDSGGFLAQSVGGGGGNGGFSVAGGIGNGGTIGGAISVSLGGSGSSGGHGEYVEGRVSGAVVTRGDRSTGVTVQSLGGGGGNGGFSIAGSIGLGGTVGGGISVGLGGAGGKAGDGARVDASAGSITTYGDGSTGFLAQSVGGGGGNGGFSVAGSIGMGGTAGGGISVGIGGSGDGGGVGKIVDAKVTGNVTTNGKQSDGIVAQSLGGGGGNGGFTIAGGIGLGGTGAGAVSVGVGGSGGTGGDSGKVDLTVEGLTQTFGADSTGIIAQSIAGGGGNGGFSVAGNIAAGGNGAGAVGVSVGGSGGDGGTVTDKVTLNVTGVAATPGDTPGAVVTTGIGSRGVLAQSVGGGGGNGGFSVSGSVALGRDGAGNIGVGVGGSGGTGGTARRVEANVTGVVITTGARDAEGILAQSIGGGGGNGGFNITGGIAASTKGAGNLLVGVGGMGGDGGGSGAVTGTVRGHVSTLGDNSAGITYQSLAGGGGNGGFNITGGVSLTSSSAGGAGNIGIGVGGFGGNGSNAGLVDVEVFGNVFTRGDKSYGVLLQSVGGGGGNGGFNITGAFQASASKGGGLGVGLGGFGGGGGEASTVTGMLQGNVTTWGDDAYGAMLQSVGGGGGNGAINVTGAMTLTSGTGGTSGFLGVGIGGFGGEGGIARRAEGTIVGDYITNGDNSSGVIVQSLGGGGGNGALNVTGQVNLSKSDSGQISVGVGGFGGDGGGAGEAWLVRNGDTRTFGANSQAILVQSVGGGGGSGGVNFSGGFVASKGDNVSVNLGLGGFGGDASHAQAVSAYIYGNVSATGLGADNSKDALFTGAVVAQSVGGGGGSGGLNFSGGVALTGSKDNSKAVSIGVGGFGGGGGNAGTVLVSLGALNAPVSVVAAGNNRAGIVAQSLGGGGGVGGINMTAGISSNTAISLGMGGFGSGAGRGEKVTVDVDAYVETTGDGTRAILAQSLGGGGGAGGINISGTANIKSEDDTSVTFGLGGTGGAGNISGDVGVTQSGQIRVTGNNGIGILAQSVAGGGGDGGLNMAVNVTDANDKKHTKRAVIGIGGHAGDGANAGNVTVSSTGKIDIIGAVPVAPDDLPDDKITTVFTSAGILAQSIGGGGGLGNINLSLSVARNAGNTAQFGMGGDGGAGGLAGTVTVIRGYDSANRPDGSRILTQGDYSSGIVAQSIGGGGGTGGMNFNYAWNDETRKPDDGPDYKAAVITVGGDGDDAGDGNEVRVRHNGEVNTNGLESHGIVAQSIGGGGGNSNVNLSAAALGEKTKSISFELGGINGSAGIGKLVDVRHAGAIYTHGDASVGIMAQSIGGGGGSQKSLGLAGLVLTVAGAALDSTVGKLSIGRKGGEGGEGGEVIVDSSGLVFTTGEESIGILAQSIGGGGGNSTKTTLGGKFKRKGTMYGGDLAVGIDGGIGAKGGTVTVTSTGEVRTSGERASAIFAQSVGGGGGLGGSVGKGVGLVDGKEDNLAKLVVNVGGDGGEASYGEQVTVTNTGNIVTSGDRSNGIWAQSVGGSGGVGGEYLQATYQNVKEKKTLSTLSVNVGGDGGRGGTGGGVKVTNKGFISTTGLQSLGIRAESVGGGGGDGGAILTATVQNGAGNKQFIDVFAGGDGGIGGIGGLVEVTNEGSISTTGMGAEGIRAASTGGGGGNAGVMMNVLFAGKDENARSQSIVLNYGGHGGYGGFGGIVKVYNHSHSETTGFISTWGDAAHGIFAQSLGGGGGNGSSIITLTGLRSKQDSVAVGLNVGGWGGAGDIGQAVMVENTGYIRTSGKDAYGILAQSIGGGGGNGGLVISAAAALGKTSKAPLISVGGVGGDGGDSGAVEVYNYGSIRTFGTNSHGIVAQSIGGGGGNAGAGFAVTNNLESMAVSNLMAITVGAVGGGSGGTGGSVKVVQDGEILVTGDGARAVVAESINGGGGQFTLDLKGITGLPGVMFKRLYMDVMDIKPSDTVTDPKIATRLGGSDLRKMNAGKVTVITTGPQGVGGNNAVGSFIQSVGGGGGTDYIKTQEATTEAVAASFEAAVETAPIAYRVDLGGENGIENTGADLDGTRDGEILTVGTNSPGVLAQTIGGGGGHAVLDITPQAGTQVGPVELYFGSSNGVDEQGGDILRTENGAVVTTGDLSAAIMMQSIGGGGGVASVNPHEDPIILAVRSAAGLDLAGQRTLQPMAAGGGATVPAIYTMRFGASGGTNLGGGDIITDFSGGAYSEGDHALGMFIQSIGAGGGVATVGGGGAADVTFGGSASATGDGGLISIGNFGDVETRGVGSHGIFLQSIGGGGGAVFGAGMGSSVTLNAANNGNGGAITLIQDGAVITEGARAHGVVAQSLGGGGGWVDGMFAGNAGGNGRGGTIDLDFGSAVIATGEGARAIFAQSLGSQGGGNITIDAWDLVRGNAAGISLDGGANNVVTIFGGATAVSGLAVSATGGNDAVVNYGVVIGDVDLGGGANSFNNRLGSAFVARSLINLHDGATSPPSGATFRNAGVFQMGLDAPRIPIDLAGGAAFDNFDAFGDPASNLLYGARVINTVALDGNFLQTPDGYMAFDVAFGPYASDRVNVTGTAQVAGFGSIILTSLGNADPVTLFAAAGGGVDNGLEIDDTLAIDYRVIAGAQGIQLAFSHDFAQPFLNGNGRALGSHMNSAITLGGSDGIGRAMALIGNLQVGEEASYAGIFDELSPEPFVMPLVAQNAAAERFGRNIFGCASSDRTCVWGHVDSHSLSQAADAESFGASGDGQSLSTGFERPLNDLWSVSLALGYEHINALSAGGGRAQSDGQSLDLGVGLRRVTADGLDLGLSLSSGWQTLDTRRMVNVFEPQVGTSKPQSTYVRAAASVGKTLQHKQLYARPELNVAVTSLSQSAFEEQGLGGIGINGDAHTQTIVSGGADLALGYVSAPGSRYNTRLEVKAGTTYRDVSDIEMAYRLAGANASADPALIATAIGRTGEHAGISYDISKADSRMTLRFSYDTATSGKLKTDAFGVRVKLKF